MGERSDYRLGWIVITLNDVTHVVAGIVPSLQELSQSPKVSGTQPKMVEEAETSPAAILVDVQGGLVDVQGAFNLTNPL